MKNLINGILALGLVFGLAACSDAQWAKTTRYGGQARVTCYTANGIFFDDYSTGAVNKEDSGADGYYFVSSSTKRLTEVTGDCVVDYDAQKPADFKEVRPH